MLAQDAYANAVYEVAEGTKVNRYVCAVTFDEESKWDCSAQGEAIPKSYEGKVNPESKHITVTKTGSETHAGKQSTCFSIITDFKALFGKDAAENKVAKECYTAEGALVYEKSNNQPLNEDSFKFEAEKLQVGSITTADFKPPA
ncbi:MAG: hypothetical protein COV47_03280 [Candidatus Diapherotrites archaeon CG11_big_fil_rev_8_21_14_0_20_37_9]|nr:MAG: hypothetical protein COV47_03280 [Candidatus Diapherotrites archaeon CG11_big_fil_rev_8_21_14_0_20_37_9]